MNLVYRYGLRPPTQNAELVHAQMRAAHAYRNILVEIERGRRAARRELDRAAPEVAALEEVTAKAEAAVVAAARAVSAAKSAARTRAVPPELREALVAARVVRKDAVAALKEARRGARIDSKSLAEVIDARAHELRTNARGHTSAYWGTYLLIEDSDRQARKTPLYDGAEPSDPRFVRWNGEGTIGVQIQGGEPISGIVDAQDTRMRIMMVPDRTGRDRPDRRFAELWMRVGSDGRAPIWAIFPMLMHRPLPDGARIKRATVSVRRVGPHEQWSAQISIDAPETSRTTRGGVVAVDLGWRQLDTGAIRVARWRGDDGAEGEIVLDARLVERLRHPEQTASLRSQIFNEARAKLVAWLATSPPIPDWLRETTSHLGQWKSAGRMASLAGRWARSRFAGDADAFDVIERWRYADRHLWNWETAERTSAIRDRTYRFRCAARALSERYDTLVLEGDSAGRPMNLTKLARRPAPDDAPAIDRALSNRQMVAAGDLRNTLTNAFRGTVVDAAGVAATRISYQPSVDTTRKCNPCGAIEIFDQAAAIDHRCSKCGAQWDQDDNAAANLLQRHRERPSGGSSPGVAREGEKANGSEAPRETRWARARRMGEEKRATAGGARETSDNAAQ